MHDFLFYLFAALTLIPAILMIISRNPVNAAMFMILALVGAAGIFVMLNAFFIAVLQVLVYAGAVMVLFLFIIMLLDVDVVSKRSPSNFTIAATIASAFLLGVGLLSVVADSTVLPSPELREPASLPSVESPMAFVTSLDAYGYSLFTKYMLPFQVAGLMLLIAMVGVIVISKRFQADDSKES